MHHLPIKFFSFYPKITVHCSSNISDIPDSDTAQPTVYTHYRHWSHEFSQYL